MLALLIEAILVNIPLAKSTDVGVLHIIHLHKPFEAWLFAASNTEEGL